MKKNIFHGFIALSLCLLVLTPAFGQDAKAILEKMIEAQGGRKALEAIQDTTVTATMEIPQFGMSGGVTIYQKEPNKMRIDIDIMGMLITQAYDGETAWATNPQTGTTDAMPPRETEYMKRQATGNAALLDPEKVGITYTFVEKETLEGKEYLVLEQKFADGFTTKVYIDAETSLIYKSKGKALDQMGVEVESETITSDYKLVDGLPVAHSMIIFQNGVESMRMTFSKVAFNSGLEDSLFKLSN